MGVLRYTLYKITVSHACMHVCMYVCVHVFVYVGLYTYNHPSSRMHLSICLKDHEREHAIRVPLALLGYMNLLRRRNRWKEAERKRKRAMEREMEGDGDIDGEGERLREIKEEMEIDMEDGERGKWREKKGKLESEKEMKTDAKRWKVKRNAAIKSDGKGERSRKKIGERWKEREKEREGENESKWEESRRDYKESREYGVFFVFLRFELHCSTFYFATYCVLLRRCIRLRQVLLIQRSPITCKQRDCRRKRSRCIGL